VLPLLLALPLVLPLRLLRRKSLRRKKLPMLTWVASSVMTIEKLSSARDEAEVTL
jgi:hypothetical protein